MRAVVQRVTSAAVRVEDVTVGEIGLGLVVLLGVTHEDSTTTATVLARKVHGLRILRGELGVADVRDAAILVVSQFTLYGDASKGRRPTWSAAAPAPIAEPLIDAFVAVLRTLGARVATGVFGAEMQLEQVNDGPITVLLEV